VPLHSDRAHCEAALSWVLGEHARRRKPNTKPASDISPGNYGPPLKKRHKRAHQASARNPRKPRRGLGSITLFSGGLLGFVGVFTPQWSRLPASSMRDTSSVSCAMPLCSTPHTQSALPQALLGSQTSKTMQVLRARDGGAPTAATAKESDQGKRRVYLLAGGNERSTLQHDKSPKVRYCGRQESDPGEGPD